MQNEYFYKPGPERKIDLGDGFDSLVKDDSVRYLVSNLKGTNAEIYASEIDWYTQNSVDSLEGVKHNLKKLYEIRTVGYEIARDVDSSVRVGKSVLVISDVVQTDLMRELEERGFSVVSSVANNSYHVSGTLGKFNVQCNPEASEEPVVEAAQIIWFSAPEHMQMTVGVYDPENLGTQKTIELISSNEGLFTYKNYIKQDWSLCLQKNKREDVCGKCVDICPEAVISKNPKDHKITLAHMQCVGCGQCVSLCPTGALDYGPVPRNSIDTVGSLFADSVVLIVSAKLQFNELSVELPSKVLPFVVGSLGFLDEDYLLSIISASTHPVVIYSDELSPHQLDQIALINSVFEKIYQRKGVFICGDVKDLTDTLKATEPLKIGAGLTVDGGHSKRERISTYLKTMVGDGYFGIILPDVQQPYGNVKINENQCTLCLSCVDACTAGAFVPHTEDNSLRFTPSLCVQCGYCEKTCPESDCLSVIYNELALTSTYFKPAIMAEDELFNCVECGVGFAPSKSINKIIELMTPKFCDDTLRIKSLSCCPDCKAKVMLEAMEANI